MYIDRPIKEYLDDLAAKKSAPGGGSAAALTAATGTSLMSMVLNFTIGRPEYNNVKERAADTLLKVQRFDSELRELIDEDVEAYTKLLDSIKAASGDEAKEDEIYKAAMEPPFLVCEITSKCIKLCRELAGFGNKNLITDAAIAAMLFEAAFFSAKFNVYANLKYIKDTDYVAKIHHILAPLEAEMPKIKEEILEVCEDAISR